MVLCCGAQNQRFGDKPGEKREGRNRCRSNDAKERSPWHRPIETAQFRCFGCSGSKKHSANTHKQKCFVQDVAKRMGGRSVEGQFTADSDPYYHEPQLIIEAVCEYPTKVVFNLRKKDWKQGHDRADVNQPFSAGKTTSQTINGEFRCEGRKRDGAGYGRGRIGVLQPVVHQRECALHPESDKDEPRAQWPGHRTTCCKALKSD